MWLSKFFQKNISYSLRNEEGERIKRSEENSVGLVAVVTPLGGRERFISLRKCKSTSPCYQKIAANFLQQRRVKIGFKHIDLFISKTPLAFSDEVRVWKCNILSSA